MSEEMKLVPMDTLIHLREYWNGARNDSAMWDALNHINEELDGLLAAPAHADEPVALCVREAEMSESNGKVTYAVFLAKSPDQHLFECHQVYSDSIKGRAQYEAARLRHFLGQGNEPCILDFDTDAHPSAGIRSEWMPIETAPKDERVFFWVVSKNADEAPLDSSGNPILGRGKPRRHEGKYGSWSGLSKAIYWMPLPAPPSALGESS